MRPSRYCIVETYLEIDRQNFYYLLLPDVREDGFYRQAMSFNAFFYSMRKPQANVTKDRQWTADDEAGIEIRKRYNRHVDWANLRTFDSIWAFYDFIGYDYKKRKHPS